MSKYRKKPVVIEAFQWPQSEEVLLLPKFLREAFRADIFRHGNEGFSIKTLEGVMSGGSGDWIIRGVKNELYPCKDDIFQATYEPVEEEEAQK